jgi:hypothetical protein
MITYRVPEGWWLSGLAVRFPLYMSYSYVVLPQPEKSVTHTEAGHSEPLKFAETDSEYRQRAWNDWNGLYNR